jgi:hypothetical protein
MDENEDLLGGVPVGFGIRSGQEPKYGTNTSGRLFNRVTGAPIPDDEPVLVLRAKDLRAVNAIEFYMNLCANEDQRAAVRCRLDDFKAFARDHADRMSEPTP